MKIAVLGGGHGAYAAAADLSQQGHEVRLWRRDAAAGVLVRFALKQYLASRLYLGTGEEPEALPVPVDIIAETTPPPGANGVPAA